MLSIWISRITSEPEDVSACVSFEVAVHVYSFSYYAIFSYGFIGYVYTCTFFLDSNSLLCMRHISFLNLLPAFLSIGIFSWTEVLNFQVAQSSSFFLSGFSVCVLFKQFLFYRKHFSHLDHITLALGLISARFVLGSSAQAWTQ